MTKQEAIEVYNGLINMKIREAFEFFAPELRKRNGKRMRKCLIYYLLGNEDECEYSIEEMVDFLREQDKQMEVDLQGDAAQFCFDNGINISSSQAEAIARHFYELGRRAER